MSSASTLDRPLALRGLRLSDLAFDRLAAAIVEGDLKPGERLNDHQLAAQLGVSRMPVREALMRLERAGLVETAASRFTRVAEADEQTVAETIEFAGYAYGNAARMAAQRMSASEHGQAVALLDRLVAADDEALIGIVREICHFVLGATGNTVLGSRTDVTYMIDRVTRELPTDVATERIKSHRDHLREAFVTRDADAAELAIRRMHGIR